MHVIAKWAIAGCLGLGGVVWAGPLDATVVDKDATWMFHVDVEAGLSSTMGQLLKDRIAAEGARPAEEIIKKFGVDPLKDIKGVTVYGFKPGEDDGVAVIDATGAVDALATRLASAGLPDYEASNAEGVARASWKGEGKTWYMAVRPTNGDMQVVVATSRGAMECGLGVVSGSRPSVTTLGKDEVLLTSPRKGSVVFGAAKGLAKAPKLRTSIVKEAQSLVIDAGEADKEMYGHVEVVATDAQLATSMQQTVQGMIGLATMMVRDQKVPGLVESLAAVKVAAEGNKVTIDCHEKADVVVERLKALESSMKEHGASVSIKAGDDDAEKKEEKK